MRVAETSVEKLGTLLALSFCYLPWRMKFPEETAGRQKSAERREKHRFREFVHREIEDCRVRTRQATIMQSKLDGAQQIQTGDKQAAG